MRTVAIALLVALSAFAFALVPTATAAGPCVNGSADNCVIEFVVCVDGPCPPRSPLLEKTLRELPAPGDTCITRWGDCDDVVCNSFTTSIYDEEIRALCRAAIPP